MYRVIFTDEFKKNVKAVAKRGYDMNLLSETIDILKEKGDLPKKYKKHMLTVNYKGLFECHIRPDWLLIWKQEEDKLILQFTNTGTHSDLFK